MTAAERDYVNITAAATLVGVSRVTIWRWIRDGRLPVSRLGHRTTRIKRADLDRLLNEGMGSASSRAASGEANLGANGTTDHGGAALETEQAHTRDQLLAIAARQLNATSKDLSPQAKLVLEQLARESPTGPDQVVQALQAMAGQAEQLARLIERVLDAPPSDKSEHAGDQAQHGNGHFSGSTAVYRVVLSDRRPVDRPTPADIAHASARLRQVLTGLLDNAIKYGPENEQIDVVVSLAAPEVVELSVPDRGGEMPPGQRIQNFERFYRDHGESRKNGLGLGQFISRQIVELHGGEIRAEFQPDGIARFVVRLPIGTPDSALAVPESTLGS